MPVSGAFREACLGRDRRRRCAARPVVDLSRAAETRRALGRLAREALRAPPALDDCVHERCPRRIVQPLRRAAKPSSTANPWRSPWSKPLERPDARLTTSTRSPSTTAEPRRQGPSLTRPAHCQRAALSEGPDFAVELEAGCSPPSRGRRGRQIAHHQVCLRPDPSLVARGAEA